MAEPVKGTFVGRFALKFVEVLGAGIATAVGSYMVAQLSGYWSTTPRSPAAVHVVPSASSTVSTPNASVVSKAPRADADGFKAAPAPDAAASAVPARTTVTAIPPSSRKRGSAEASAEAKPPEKDVARPLEKEAKAPEKEAKEPKSAERESKAAAKEAKPQEKETADTKARDKDDEAAIEAQVRAALANVDASHPAPPPQTAIPVAIPAAVPKSETPPGPGNVATIPRAADAAPTVQPASAPASAAPLAPVEIKSHPIADVDLAAQGDVQTKPEAAQNNNDKGVFAAFKKIPEFFRTDTHPAEDPPRPPQSVGD